MSVLHQIIIVALITTFIVLLISKIGLRDFIITEGPEKVSQLFSCDFCLCFWIGLTITLIAHFVVGWPFTLILPACSTPMARYLL